MLSVLKCQNSYEFIHARSILVKMMSLSTRPLTNEKTHNEGLGWQEGNMYM